MSINVTDKEKAIDYLKESVLIYKNTIPKISEAIETVLSLIKEQQIEIKKLKENVDYQILCDFLIGSVFGNGEPIWTEEHIEELLDNFEVRWKKCT